MSETPVQAGQMESLLHQPDLPTQLVRRMDYPAFYRAEKKHLIAFMVYVGASMHEADDFAHDALISLLPDLWQSMEYPRAYMRRVAFHAYLKQEERTREVPTEQLPELPGGVDPVTHVELSEKTKTVIEAISQLSPVQRAVMAFVLSDADANEIAEALNMKLGAVYTNICRARTRLKSALGLVKGEKDA